jgi:hypothetical protein
MPTYLTKKEAAGRYRRHTSSIMRMVRDGILTAPIRFKDGGPVLFNEQVLEQDIEKLRSKAQRLTAEE